MTLIFEVSKPFQAKPSVFKSRIMTRYTWGYFSFSKLHVPFKEFCTTAYSWANK